MKKLLIPVLLCLAGLAGAQTPEVLRGKSADLSMPAAALSAVAVPAVPAAADNGFSPYEYLASLNGSAPSQLNISRSGNRIIIDGSIGALSKSAYSAAYKYGDVVFLIGHLDDAWTKNEWTRYYSVAKWLVQKGFRVVMNPVASVVDIRASVQDDRTKVIIWSSHGSTDGGIYDSGKELVPTDAFATNAGRNFKQIITSACYGEVMVKRYKFPAGLKTTHWEGTTTSDDLFNYLLSDRWDPRAFGENIE